MDGTKFSPAFADELRRLARSGRTLVQIGEVFGVSRYAVRRWMNKLAIEMAAKKRATPATPEERKQKEKLRNAYPRGPIDRYAPKLIPMDFNGRRFEDIKLRSGS